MLSSALSLPTAPFQER